MRNLFYLFSVIGLALTGGAFFYSLNLAIGLAVVVIPLVIVGLLDIFQSRQTIRKNYPVVGRMRYWMEELRPKIYQYFVESDIDGTPVNRTKRSVVYQRAKGVTDTKPFGTQEDVYGEGYEWINHSMYPLKSEQLEKDAMRVMIGGKECKKPYNCSIFNISAMSYGSLSKTAILALNKGAKIGGFAHNTGEGSISPFHIEGGGDIIWQIGTGYFGTRTEDGQFSEEKFKNQASRDNVKMIEIKLSQGAKPGHGGILPSKKNTDEIAGIRGVKAHTTVHSPPCHTAFNNNSELLEFIVKLRNLSGGKPVGIKLCFGNRLEFHDLCQKMVATGIRPDFIAVDGAEGGTGAAPIEFSDSIGTPLKEGLLKVNNILAGYNLREDIKIIASGKILNGFDIIRAFALGADVCYSARGMLLALGCIQALLCNTNKCPVGITTQDKSLYTGLNPEDKGQRIANYHHQTIDAVKEILMASKTPHPRYLDRTSIYRRVSPTKVKNFEEIYPHREPGSLLSKMEKVS